MVSVSGYLLGVITLTYFGLVFTGKFYCLWTEPADIQYFVRILELRRKYLLKSCYFRIKHINCSSSITQYIAIDNVFASINYIYGIFIKWVEKYLSAVVSGFHMFTCTSIVDAGAFFNEISGRTAYIGIGFGDRSDSFDLNVALQDHFKWVKKEKQISEEPSAPSLDLGFKEGETIKINMKITVSD